MLEQLAKASSVATYLEENEENLIHSTLAEHLAMLLEEKGLPKGAVIKQAEMNEIYGYQIFSGKRVPSRDKLLCLALGMHLTLEETQQLLKASSMAPLYPKNKRDSFIIFGIQHGQSVLEINNALYEANENTLG